MMHPLPSVFLMELDIPTEFVESCNDYLDELLEQDDKVSAAHTLVGQIKTGEQLVMDHEDPRLVPFSKFLCEMSVTYINQFMAQSGQVLDGNRSVEMDELWSVHSYQGDYNPIHDHGTKTVMGVSCTTWTKVPPQIAQGSRPGSQEYGRTAEAYAKRRCSTNSRTFVLIPQLDAAHGVSVSGGRRAKDSSRQHKLFSCRGITRWK